MWRSETAPSPAFTPASMRLGAGAKHRIINIRAEDSTIAVPLASIWLALTIWSRDVRLATIKLMACLSPPARLPVAPPATTAVVGIGLQSGAGSVIGNVANNNSRTTGFNLGTGNIVVDRNSADGNGTNYGGGPANAAYWGINAGR